MANARNECNDNAKLKYNVTELISDNQNIPNEKKIRGDRDVQIIPFIGKYFADVFRNAGYETVDHIVRGFTAYPPLSAEEIEEILVSMCQNKNRDTCQQKRNDPEYHVSDVNQCCFNSILELLREFHRKRIEYVSLNLTVYPNIPNATQVNFRNRGDNQMVRRCVCYNSEEMCRRNRCRWTPPGTNGTNTSSGACTPRYGEGFRGNNEETNQFLSSINNQNNVQQVNGLPYVRQYRVLGAVRNGVLNRNARSRIILAPNRLGLSIRRGHPRHIYSGRLRSSNLQGGGVNNTKKDILYAEKWNKKIDLTVRRQFNRIAKVYNENVKKKNCNEICLNYQGIRHCFPLCSVKDWFHFNPIQTYLGKKYIEDFI